jgi:release factor glutamine methyltransferase
MATLASSSTALSPSIRPNCSLRSPKKTELRAQARAGFLHMNALPATLGEALQWARQRVDSVDARILLREAAQVSAATLVAYLLGVREFYGRDFAVSPATLIPRPDTELLIELALQQLQGIAQPRILDLGTGSGAIGVTLALERPDAAVCAVDLSTDALDMALGNAQRLGAKMEGLAGSWFAPLAGRRFDLIVSNPPYIEADDPHLAQGDLRFEPRSALASGTDGFDDIRQIVAGARAHLVAGGWLLFEHGYNQAGGARALLTQEGFSEVRSWNDLAGIERVSGGRFDTV